jgi:hypothetical protein
MDRGAARGSGGPLWASQAGLTASEVENDRLRKFAVAVGVGELIRIAVEDQIRRRLDSRLRMMRRA